MRLQAWLGVFLLTLSSLLHAAEFSPYTATYRFNLDNKLSGTATRVLEKRDNNLWRYTFTATTAVASATETSDFRFDGTSVKPLGYQQKRKVFFSKKNARVDFDWAAGKGTGTRDGKSPANYKLQPGTVDALNMEIQFRRDLKETGKLAGPYALATPKELTPLTFVIEGKEVLQTPFGKLNTLRVSRKHADPHRRTTFWLAVDYDYLPAKVMQDDDGSIYLLELSKYQPAAKSK
jgi:hypothetical protein